ncbi:MAG: hypothetical protein KAS69_03240 [Planctomycetes bacterium]|nr:hypothetical protein [Planctomycetota bacterium]
MQLKVVKANGSTEPYLHTKVIGTISNAIAAVGDLDVCAAEELADVVTYYAYHNRRTKIVSTSEIFSLIKVVLTATGYEEAAAVLNEHHFQRKLRRSRIMVTAFNIQNLSEVDVLCDAENLDSSHWDKSIIADCLVSEHNISRQTAKMIAAMVENKILNMGMTLVPTGLIKHLVFGDAVAVLRAQRQLELA